MKFRLLIIMIICWLVSCGNGSTKETDKIVDHIDGVIENTFEAADAFMRERAAEIGLYPTKTLP